MIFFFWTGLMETVHAFQIGERSDLTTWMPSLLPFKAAIPGAVALLLLQGVSELIKSLHAATTGRQL
jgi:TRAP-type mannitol/chloroaromatic compound transport system permease small subunit